MTRLIAEATKPPTPTWPMAAARVKQARAIAGIAEAPTAFRRSASTHRRPASAWQSDVALGLPDRHAASLRAMCFPGAVLTASYEVDLFGRVSAGVAAANSDAAASEATYRSVLLSLQADVAQTYYRLRAIDAELATLRRTVDLRAQSVKVNQSRFDNGDIGEFDLARSRTELSTTRAEAIGVERARTQNEHALAVLLGKPAAMFAQSAQPLDGVALPVIPAGLPSRLLERRPDIAAAQRSMMASNARIGLARAAMYPALNLNGALGTESASTGNLFAWSARSWVLGALLSMPIIDGGRNKANITRSEAVLEESVAAYRQNVLVAFADVEDNLAGLRILAGQAGEIDAAVVSARRSADLAQKLYSAGRSSYLDLLDAQRNLAAVERTAVQLRGNQAVTTVALVRSLGGGWEL